MQSSLPRASHFPDRCIRPRTNRRSSRISLLPRLRPATKTFPSPLQGGGHRGRGRGGIIISSFSLERKEYYDQSLDRAFQIAYDASYNFAITRTLLNCLCPSGSLASRTTFPSLPSLPPSLPADLAFIFNGVYAM